MNSIYEQCNRCFGGIIVLVSEPGYDFLGWVMEYEE